MQSLMQKTAAQRASVARTSRPARASRAVVVRAEHSRREIFGGVLATVASLALSQAAQAETPVDLLDDRKAVSKGFNIIYEARDDELPFQKRDGLTQARQNLAGTLARVKESESRIDSSLSDVIAKQYWTEAREQLRRQVGTLRFDLNTLAEAKPKADKKKALDLKKTFLSKVESLDLAIRQKNKDAAISALAATQSSLDAVIAACS